MLGPFTLPSHRTYAELLAAWRSLRGRGYGMREVACANAPRTIPVVDLGRPDAPVVCISAGVHGDEPTAPWALLSLLRDGLLDDRFAYRLWPCLNPTGTEAGTRANAEGDDINRSFSRGGTTPEARAVLTANRDRTFVLSIDLHEDFEAAGVYLYEPLRADAVSRYAAPIVRALDAAGLPVEDVREGFDLGAPPGIDPRTVYTLGRGTVLVDYDAEVRAFPGLPHGLALMYRGTAAALTIESPRTRPWDERIAAHRVAVTTALAHTI